MMISSRSAIAFFIAGICLAGANRLPGQETSMEEVVVFDSALEDSSYAGEGVSVDVLDGEDLSLWNADSPRDLPGRVPNFFTTDTGTQGYGDVLTIRGLGNTPFFSNPSVIYYVDGVALGDAFSYSDSLVDVESVEVFRGPQGARFGRNAYGGAVNLKTKRPENEWRMALGGTAGEYDRYGTNGSLSGALVEDVLHFRLNGYHSERDGFLFNSTLGLSPDDESRSGGGGTLYWTPSEDWEIRLGGNRESFDNGSPRLVPLPSGNDIVASNVRGQLRGDSATASLGISYNGDDFRFDAVSAYRNWEIDPFLQDLDLSPAAAFPFGGFTLIQQEQERWSQEIRFSSPEENATPIDWSAGIYGAAAETNHNGFNTFTGLTTYSLEETEFAIFSEGALDVTDRLRAILGLRYDSFEKDLVRANTAFGATAFGDDWDFVSPSFTLEYEANDNLLLYATTAYTSKPGGFSAFANTPALVRYDSEENWANEIGVKASGLDGRLRGRAAAFYYDIDDYQVERPVATGVVPNYVILNAAEASSYGGEVEVEFEVIPGLTIDGSIGVTETELDRFTDPVSGAVLDGNEAPYVPEFDFVVGASWEAENGLFARVEYRGVGDTYYDDFNTPAFREGAYGVLNARVGYRKDNFVISVFATNLSDENYYSNINPGIPVVFAPPAIGAGTPGEPRQVGVMATIEF